MLLTGKKTLYSYETNNLFNFIPVINDKHHVFQ